MMDDKTIDTAQTEPVSAAVPELTEPAAPPEQPDFPAEKGNILVIGNSGVGKSTLINAVLGEDRAETGWGLAGTTRDLQIYEGEGVPFRIIDTIGFEPTFTKELKAVRAVQRWSRESAKNGGEEKRIHVIWFCVDGTARKLFSKAIADLSRATSLWRSVPVIAVITKSYSVPERAENIEMVRQAFASQKRFSASLRDIIPVVAAPYVLNESAYAPPEGITALVEATNTLLPEGIAASNSDISSFNLGRKRAMSQALIGAATAAAAVVGAIPIPFSDALILSPTEMAEVSAISRIYGIDKNEETTRLLDSIIEVGTVSAAAKATISALKSVPGLNLGVSALNALIAGAFVAALGEGAAYVFEQIYLGKKSIEDIDWVRKALESRLTGDAAKKTGELAKKLPEGAGKEAILAALKELLKK